jgi:hypothetical protein
MKKIVISIAILFGVNCLVIAQSPITIYGGLNIAGSSTKDFVKFDISDWENYGLLSENPSSVEGRVSVDLASMKPNPINIGLMLGGRYNLNEKFSALAEVQYTVSGISLLGVYAGVNYDLVKKEKFSLGFTPKIGYNVGSADLGTISLISGYTPPVILTEGTFTEGDALSMDFSGIAINLGLTPTFAITEKLSIMGLLGYNLSFASSDGLRCVSVDDGSEIILPMSAVGIVKSDGSGTQAGISPLLSSSGLSLQIGLSYKIGN